MADDLSLLFRLKAQNQASPAIHAVQADVQKLRQTFGGQFGQMQQVATVALGRVSQNLTNVTGQIPILGSVVNALTSDLAQLGTSATATGASLGAVAGPVAAAVLVLGAEIAAVITLTQKLFALAKASAEYQGKLFDLSQQVGVSVETLSALEVQAATTGSSIDALVQSLGIFQKHLEDAQDESSKSAQTFKQLGVETNNTEDALRQTIAALARMPEGFKQTALALEVFGRGGKAFLAIAKETKGDIDEITRRFGAMGLVTTEQAKIADQFNDQLVLLDVQLRGLGTQAIPAVLGALQHASKFFEENREAMIVLQGAIRGLALSITIPLRLAIVSITLTWKSHLLVIQGIVATYQSIANAIGLINRTPLRVPTPPTPPTEPTDSSKEFLRETEEEIAARKRLQSRLELEVAQKQKAAEASIAAAQREFDAGKKTRKELLDTTIAANRARAAAELDHLQEERSIRLRSLALAEDDAAKRAQIEGAIDAIDVQMANKRADLRRQEADLRARFQLDERRSELAHEQAKLDTLTKVGQNRIAVLEEQLRLEVADREKALAEIEKIEDTTLRARGQLLKRELELAGVGPDRQGVLERIKALEADRTALERQQGERRKQLTREEFETKRQIIESNLDAIVQQEQIIGERRVDSLKRQAEQRVITEEEAAKQILKIRLDIIDDEIAATETKLTAAKSITDKNERARIQAELNNQIKILNEERKTIQAEGDRDIEEGRQRDLQNERRYANELKNIKQRIRDIERDSAQEVIRLMAIHFASRRDIIRARLQADIADENARHAQANETLDSLLQENRESKKTQEDKLATERELNLLREAEAERHRLAMQGIKDQGKKDEEEADPLGRFSLDNDSLKEFASIIEDSIVPLGEILRNTFLQVADAIGQTVQNWVLLGETGPAVMRKILAQALASIAAEAAVNAIKELALGFATLFFNPAESAAHFTAAGLWASIGVGSALAGRAVAGDLFKSKSAGSGGGSTSRSSGELNPLNLARNAGPGAPQQIAPQIQPIRVQISVNDGKFAKAVTATVVDDFNNAGPIREIVSGDGNLNRG